MIEPHFVELIEMPRGGDPKPSDFPGRAAEAPQEVVVSGHHLRAARGMLGWPLHRLADTSRLSVSTLRRLEEDRADASNRSRFRAVVALSDGGVRFVLINGRVVGVATVGDVAAACLPP